MTEKIISKLSDSELDALLLEKVEKRWSKVARIIGDVMFALDALTAQDEQRLLSRVEYLAESGKIESAGDVKNPRFSEIRLPI
ncbi:MAG: hypothetical protein DYH13_01100 [Alphaproteobacteria bacterium PRO2]|nr:hypothetical protein [Alphaproteobacteria bacterium PRO2]